MKTNAREIAKPRYTATLMRLLRSLATAAGYLGIAAGLLKPMPAAAQELEYRRPDAVPAAWLDYAQRVQGLFRARLTADDEAVRLLHADSSMSGSRVTVFIRAWVAGDGKVERVEFSGLADSAAVALRSVLMRGDIGAPPPAGMLQPLNLKLSLEISG